MNLYVFTLKGNTTRKDLIGVPQSVKDSILCRDFDDPIGYNGIDTMYGDSSIFKITADDYIVSGCYIVMNCLHTS
jgi:hypothetical protein